MDRGKYREILSRLEIFKNITEFEYKNIMAEIRVAERNFSKDSVILHQGDIYNDLHIIINGSCIGQMIDFSGKCIKIEDFISPFILASGILFLKKNILPVTVIAITDTKFLTINKNDVLKLCTLRKKFLKNFLADVSDKIVFISEKL